MRRVGNRSGRRRPPFYRRWFSREPLDDRFVRNVVTRRCRRGHIQITGSVLRIWSRRIQFSLCTTVSFGTTSTSRPSGIRALRSYDLGRAKALPPVAAGDSLVAEGLLDSLADKALHDAREKRCTEL